METVTRTAWDPITEREYEIELPVESIVEMALLKLDYPTGGLHKTKVVEILAQQFALTDEQKNAKHKNGFRLFNYHVGRVTGALVRSGKMVKPKRSWRGINPEQISETVRETENSFDDQADTSDILSKTGDKSNRDRTNGTSERSIEENYQQIRKELAAELLQRIRDNTPAFFEELVIDLLVAMGYGGSREDAQAVGRSGDGGIDGIINEDRLGLDVIYVQAKRWEGNVGEPEIARFAGALAGRGATKGIFITTSDFTRAARAYDASGFKIVLIDGHQLAQLMIDHDVGVSVEKTYEIKRVDSDYFAENAE
jgi:restriction system protein